MADRFVIRFVAFNGIPGPIYEEVPEGSYLKMFDPDAHDGGGAAEWTDAQDEALIFSSAQLAVAFWRSQSAVRPLRADGKANRPLTAARVEISKL